MKNFKIFWAVIMFALTLMPLIVRGEDAPLSTTASMPNIYSSHMVIQRQMPIVFVGSCESEKSVLVTFADNKTQKVTANKDGEWRVEFPAQEAGGPFNLKVKTLKGDTIAFSDIMVGEVWICSGQSNMSVPLWSKDKFWRSHKGDEEVARANHPNLRFFSTKQITSKLVQEKDLKGSGWTVCKPENIAAFSAVGYYFGLQLLEDLKVPIGLIGSNWGGSRIEAWMSEESLKSINHKVELDVIEAERKKSNDSDVVTENPILLWEKRFLESNAKATKEAKPWSNLNFNDKNWKDITLPKRFSEFEENDGIIWVRREVEIPKSWANKELTLSLGAIDDCDETWFNGEKIGVTDNTTPNYWLHKRVYKVPAKLVKAGRAVIAIRVVDFLSEGGFSDVAKLLKLDLDANNTISLAGKWKYNVEFFADKKKLGNKPVISNNSKDFPSTLYNAMISPWTLYPVRGAIWYQGESNAGKASEYATLQNALIADWRKKWNNPEFAFLFVQLASYDRHVPKNRLPEDAWKKEPAGSNRGYSFLREAQIATLKVPNTGMAVSIDIGDQSDIHPQHKRELGYRLAKEAGRVSYGSKEVSHGPYFKDMKCEGRYIHIYFTGVGSGLMAKGEKLTGFVVAGKNGKYYHAEAKIVDDSVVVWSDQVEQPTAVKYAWAPYPGDANLFNKEEFPASPFRAPSSLRK